MKEWMIIVFVCIAIVITVLVFIVLIKGDCQTYNKEKYKESNKFICNHYKQKDGIILKNAQVWSHRGIHNNVSDQNTPEAIKLAKINNFKGSEIDVFFDDVKKKFIVSHDKPYNLKNGRIVYLEDIVKVLDNHYLWLDFKNLNNSNVEDSIQYLNKKFCKYKGQILVESQNKNISKFTKAGFITNYGINNIAQTYDGTICTYYSGFAGVYDNLKDKLKTDKKFNIFTVNDLEKIRKYKDDPKIGVILTDLHTKSD